jgi:hypothetical protein
MAPLGRLVLGHRTGRAFENGVLGGFGPLCGRTTVYTDTHDSGPIPYGYGYGSF